MMISKQHHDVMKRRTQIQLDPEDHEALRRWASARGISMSAAVRMLVRIHVRGEPALPDDVTARFLGAAGCIRRRKAEGSVSVHHDEVLYGSES